MTESRFRPLSLEELTPEQLRVRAALVQSPRGALRGPYLSLIHSPELADRMRHLGDFIRFGGVLPRRVKEIVILLNARRWSVDYMFAVHREMAAEAGIDPAIVDAIAEGRRPAGLSPDEAAAYDVAAELLERCAVGDAAFAAARDRFGEAGVVELVTFVGYYTALAMILNASRAPLPDGARPLPPLAR